jgi:alpha-tubulin suppressor-like RCC1 family protein
MAALGRRRRDVRRHRRRDRGELHDAGDTTIAADDGDRYRVIVSNLEGATTSAAATLTVTANLVPPAIAQQPQDVTVAVGGNATFTVAATGTNVQYQWQRSNDGSATFADIAGAANASFTLTNVQASDNDARFRARAFNGAGSVTSNAARLTVGSPPPPPPATGPRIAAGNSFSLARNAAGTALLSWGTDSGEALGNGTGGDRNVPGPIALPVQQPASFITTGSGARHGLLIADRVLWGWGYNGFGQLGRGHTNSLPAPLPVEYANGFVVSDAAAAAAGTLHTLILRTDGRVFATGFNASGQLGDGTTTDRLRAVEVPGLANITAIAAGGQFSLALRSDGTVWAWGANNAGQLGDGTTTSRSSPVQVSGLAGVTAIAAGTEHALALRADRSVWAWGANGAGQLGDNTTVSRTAPVRAVIGSVLSIAAGGSTSVAMSEGPIAWGSNSNGQLGTGSLAPAFRSFPSSIPTLPGGTYTFAVGANHVLALRDDGTLWAWGGNDSGQIGNGTTGGNVLAPVQVPNLNLN